MATPVSAGLDSRLIIKRPGFRLDAAVRIDQGETVALLGPNGAGKSTVVGALAGLVALDGGFIRLGDRVLEDAYAGVFVPPADRGIGVMFQDGILFPHMSALENVAFGLRSRKMPRREARLRAAGWLEAVGLDGLADRRPDRLSGGQRQRVALARALTTEPSMLLLDEPFSALDISSRTGLRHLLRDHLAGFPGPALLITHDPTEAFLLADRLIVLENGAVAQEGSADQIRLRPASPYAADLAGVNLVIGTASGRVLAVGDHRLMVAETHSGRAIATIHPRAISIHLDRPGGSPRNSWRTTIERIDHHADRVRVQTSGPLPVTAEITPEAQTGLNLVRGSEVWLSVKATEIQVSAG